MKEGHNNNAKEKHKCNNNTKEGHDISVKD